MSRSPAPRPVKDAIRFEQFTSPLRKMLGAFVESGKPEYVVSFHQPRIVDGKPTKNPRNLQNRPDLEDPRAVYLANLGARFYRALAVYGPNHYQELPGVVHGFHFLAHRQESVHHRRGQRGRKYRVDHDISLLVPEVWSRMFIPEREPNYLIKKGYLEKVVDLEHEGKRIEAKATLTHVSSPAYRASLVGVIGTDPALV